MDDVAKSVRKPSLPPPTPLEDLEYAINMLRAIRPKVAPADALLTNLVDMAIMQGIDLLAGRVPMQRRAPPQNGTIAYKR